MTLRDELLASFRAILDRCYAEAPELLVELRSALDESLARAAATGGDSAGQGEGWHGLIGECAPMLELRGFIEKFAKANAPVLVTGESGTGKERVAQAVHALSPRRGQAFVPRSGGGEALVPSRAFR